MAVAITSGSPALWIDIEGGLWSDPTNWSTGSVPGPGDVAFITLPGVYIVIARSSPIVGGLIIGGDTTSQTLWVQGSGPGGHANLTATTGIINAGIIRVESIESSWQSNLAVTSGTLINTGTININQGSGGPRNVSANLTN